MACRPLPGLSGGGMAIHLRPGTVACEGVSTRATGGAPGDVSRGLATTAAALVTAAAAALTASCLGGATRCDGAWLGASDEEQAVAAVLLPSPS